ncbi:MAG: NUDIX domain-containing protein [Gemmatimonas sp.]|nr:NUDIX domain-containing protein [Gemmatimonas sp.]
MSTGHAGDEVADELTPISSRPVHRGRVVDLSVDTVRFPDGSSGELEMIRHSGAAAVLPLLDSPPHPDPTIVLVRQFRYAAGGYLFEVPAGRPDHVGEAWDVCARRELREETGYSAGQLRYLTSILTTPGFTDERIHLFLATDLSEGEIGHDDDEFMELAEMRLSEAVNLVREGRISDAKTLCTLLFARQFLLS